jgi:hypothetical protein
MIAIGQTDARDSAFSKAIQIKKLAMFVGNNVTDSDERLNGKRLIFNTLLLPVRAEIYIVRTFACTLSEQTMRFGKTRA